jgi:YVTN family beta-propeller protein
LPIHGRALLALACVAALTACSSAPAAEEPPLTTAKTTTTTPPTAPKSLVDGLPGMPAVTDRHNVYANAGANMVQDALKQDKPLVYVPHSGSGDVWVIDPTTFQVVAKYPAGVELQHVVPSYDMRTLYATDDRGDHLVPFDPKTGQP